MANPKNYRLFEVDSDDLAYLALQIREWQRSATHFTGKLLALIGKADLGNRERIRMGFPSEVQAYEMWFKGAIGNDGRIDVDRLHEFNVENFGENYHVEPK